MIYCEWKLERDDGGEPQHWETECGQAYMWFGGGLPANHYHYCPSCGRVIWEAEGPWTQAELDAAEQRAAELGRLLEGKAG